MKACLGLFIVWTVIYVINVIQMVYWMILISKRSLFETNRIF